MLTQKGREPFIRMKLFLQEANDSQSITLKKDLEPECATSGKYRVPFGRSNDSFAVVPRKASTPPPMESVNCTVKKSNSGDGYGKLYSFFLKTEPLVIQYPVR